MLKAPIFTSENEYRLHRADIDFWWLHIVNILERHHLVGADKRAAATCGFNPTYPVFLIDDIVIKFFGHRYQWLSAFKTECVAHECLIQNNKILAPRILVTGQLFASSDAPWSYIISSKI